MKKLILLVVLACCAVTSFAVPLPEGSDARITEVRQNNGKIVYVRLKEATTLNTPLGALDAVEEVFFYENGNIQKFQPAVSGEYVSPVGNLTYTTAPISFYESHFTAGAYRGRKRVKDSPLTMADEPLLIVSRGLSNEIGIPRLGNPEEIVILEFSK